MMFKSVTWNYFAAVTRFYPRFHIRIFKMLLNLIKSCCNRLSSQIYNQLLFDLPETSRSKISLPFRCATNIELFWCLALDLSTAMQTLAQPESSGTQSVCSISFV
uniref:(northern house mosquito) hypothetical protein n=1 Tax=Culex pipiens TaxID=7175 RepID=A0A8D8KG96_CULPI